MSELTLSEKIQQCTAGVVANPYQGEDKKVLFVCTMGILRSATAARIYAHKYNTRSAGTSAAALVPLTETLIEWADEIVFVNKENYAIACLKFDGNNFIQNKLLDAVVLNIPDIYEHKHPKMVEAFEEQYERV